MPRRPETITEARAALAACPADELDALIRRLARDPRAGVRRLADAARSRLARMRAEDDRLDRLMDRQRELTSLGFSVIVGIDEVGRGALAGPVTACAVVLPLGSRLPGLDDSKRLAPDVRVRLADAVRTTCVACCVAHAGPDEIDRLGIGAATRLAWRRALDGLPIAADHVLLDGNDSGALGVPTTAVVKGDSSVACIAAASIVAKVARDELLSSLEADFPGYGFDIHHGYGTPEHLAAIRELGASRVHRHTFAGCAPQDTLF